MSKINFNPKDFGLKIGYLYEIIATTYSLTEDEKEIKPNASCMGIRLLENTLIQISPYSTTSTYKNLKKNGIIAINFTDNVYLYALAALKDQDSPIGLTEFPPEHYDFKYLETLSMDLPYLKDTWGILICEISQEFKKKKNDVLGDIMIPVFILKTIFYEKFRNSFKIINRTENLALETIILATRLKIAKNNDDDKLFHKIYDKILDYIENIERFGKNKDALMAIDLVNNYINNLD